MLNHPRQKAFEKRLIVIRIKNIKKQNKTVTLIVGIIKASETDALPKPLNTDH